MPASEGERNLLRAVESGWQAALDEIRRAEKERTDLTRARFEAIDQRNARIGRALIALALTVVMVVTAGLALFGWQLNQNTDTADRTKSLVTGLQKSRRESVTTICEQTQGPHGTNAGIHKFIHEVSPKLDGLSTQLFPVERDCAGYAKRATAIPPH